MSWDDLGHAYVWYCDCARCRGRTRYYAEQARWWLPRVISVLGAAKRGRRAVVTELQRQGFRVVVTPRGLQVRLGERHETKPRRHPARET